MRDMRMWVAILFVAMVAGPAQAAWQPDGVDLTRPRLLMRPGDVAVVQERVQREPYRRLLVRIVNQANSSLGWDIDDHEIPAEREKSKGAKGWAFLYAIDRTIQGGVAVPFATPEARQAAGDHARDYLLAMYTVSRIAEIFDRDINTSEEIVSYATAYDTLLGAGYPFAPEDEAAIRANLIALTSDLYEDYLGLDPEVGTSAVFLTNNHRTKSGAALAAGAIALAEHTPAPGSDPTNIAEPADWFAYGYAQIDRVLRFAYLTGDGAYSEGPYYARYSGQNHLPLLRAVDRLASEVPGPVFGLPQPNFWRHPLFARHQQWMLDMTLPDGSMAHIDDGNVGHSYYYGMLSRFADAPLFHWAWANGREPFVSEGSIDLAADQIVNYDDAIAAAPPSGSPTSFYVEGGNAIFRADWSRDAVVAIALGEHGIANEFARDEQGRGIVVAASHEQAEAGAFLLYAFGEQLAIDPGYFTFPERNRVALPRQHNMVLVDDKGPTDPFTATLLWGDRIAEPRADGQSTISATLDSGFLDAATISSSYAGTPVVAVPPAVQTKPSARVQRRFLFPDHRYLIVADFVRSTQSKLFTWLLHGNGGPGSDGDYAATPNGASWTIRGARLDGAIAIAGATPSFSTSTELHEIYDREERSHTVLRASATGPSFRSVMLAVPTHSADAAPAVTSVVVDGGAALAFRDVAGDRIALAVHRTPGQGETEIAVPSLGLRAAATDGSVWSFDAHADGALRSAFADAARVIRYDGATWIESASPGSLGIRPEATRAEVVAQTADAHVTVRNLAFTPVAADGACDLEVVGADAIVTMNRSRVVTLRDDAGNAAPAADAGASPRRADVGDVVRLDARASCDLDGDALTFRWKLVSAPAGSAWSLADDTDVMAALTIDRRGPYRVQLLVTDLHGGVSRPAEAVVYAGNDCEDHVDEDLDGLIDQLDPQCPSPGEGAGVGCGLLSAEVLPVLAWAALRRTRRRA
jgi:hypothetical protein